MLSDQENINEIVSAFHIMLRTKNKEISPLNSVIIGVGIDGAILASNYCTEYNYPFLLSLENNFIEKHDFHDIFRGIDEKDKKNHFIIMTSTIITGKTVSKIQEIIQQVDQKADIIVLTVFNRIPSRTNYEFSDVLGMRKRNKDIIDKVIAINDEFKVEICDKIETDCLLCKTNNKKCHNREVI